MKTRVIAALSLLPVFLLILLACPVWATAILVAAMSAVAVHELLITAGLLKNIRITAYSAAAAAAISLWSGFGCPRVWGAAIVFLYFIALFAELLAAQTNLPLHKLCVAAFAALAVPYMLSAMVRILYMEQGRFYIIVALILAFTSDTGAYFAGRKFGKHKLAPVISPHKTVEGFVGGIVSCVVFMLLYCLVLQLAFRFTMDYISALIYGVLGSLGSVMGDLVFSTIKRQSGIKDYGKLMPGHGGVLDRFDSMVVAAPLTELLRMVLPLIVKGNV